MINRPHIILTQDQHWDPDRPLPLEPTRWGEIKVLKSNILKQYPLIKKYLNKNHSQGAYFSSQTTKQLLQDKNQSTTLTDQQLLKVSSDFSQLGDKTTSYVLNSLIFTTEDYQYVEKQVHYRLTTSMLGPNPDTAASITEYFLQPRVQKQLLKFNTKKNPFIILDPFAGHGGLSFLIARILLNADIKNFKIINNDLSPRIKTRRQIHTRIREKNSPPRHHLPKTNQQ